MITRRDFVKMGCAACAGAPFLLLESCESVHYVQGTMEPTGLSVLQSEFNLATSPPGFRQYVIVRNERLEFPICIYRSNENEFNALLMRCTHQGTELQAFGDHLQCPAHGSEFNSKGQVAQGPAEQNLRVFPVRVEGEKIMVDLK